MNPVNREVKINHSYIRVIHIGTELHVFIICGQYNTGLCTPTPFLLQNYLVWVILFSIGVNRRETLAIEDIQDKRPQNVVLSIFTQTIF